MLQIDIFLDSQYTFLYNAILPFLTLYQVVL